MSALFNIVCFALTVAVAATAACSAARVANLQRELRENEAEMLLRRARANASGQEGDLSGAKRNPRQRGTESLLVKAGLPITAGQWKVLTLGAGLLLASALFIAAGSARQCPMAMKTAVSLLGLLAVFAGSRRYLAARMRKQVLLLEKQLAQAEMQIAENSRSGLPVSRSIVSCAELAQEPLKSHLRRLCNEMAYSGCTLADGLSNMARRTGSSDARLLAEVVSIQQETGSNLADALDFLHETISKRLEMRQSLQSALAETKITKTIVAITPWAIFILLSFAPLIRIEGFWDFYATNPIGWAVLVVCLGTEAAILALISHMSKLEID